MLVKISTDYRQTQQTHQQPAIPGTYPSKESDSNFLARTDLCGPPPARIAPAATAPYHTLLQSAPQHPRGQHFHTPQKQLRVAREDRGEKPTVYHHLAQEGCGENRHGKRQS